MVANAVTRSHLPRRMRLARRRRGARGRTDDGGIVVDSGVGPNSRVENNKECLPITLSAMPSSHFAGFVNYFLRVPLACLGSREAA